jgi:filamentous hemagglutinin family protein
MSDFRLRLLLLAGCAVSAMAAGGPAEAQLTPDASATQFNAGGGGPTISQLSQTTDVTLNASRTVIGWSSYNLASNQTVIYRFPDRGSIVLNKISGPATIDGQIEALVGSERGAGNVWFQAPGGVIFGPNAQVTVGGLLVTPATVSAGFLDPGNFSFDFTGASAAPLTVHAGAQIKATSGALALVAANITTETGSTMSSGSGASVLYGAANDYTIRFAAQSSGDLDLVDFVVPAAGGTASATPLSLEGQTVGGSVFLAVVNRSDVASAVISAPGLIAAQSATVDHGDVVLSAGIGIVARQPGGAPGNTTTPTTVNLDIITAQRDLLGGFAQPTTLTANQLAAGRDLGLLALNLNAAALHAGRTLAVNAGQAIKLGADSTVGGSAALRTTGALTVGNTGTGAINVAGSLQIDAGSVQAGALNAGRSMVVNASGAGPSGGPAVSLATALAGDDITINSTNATGSIALGRASITGAGPDAAPAGRNLSLNASGASADVTYGGATGATLIGVTGVALNAGRDVTANVNGVLTLTQGSAGRTFTVRAQDLNINGPLKTADLRVESLSGGFTLGGGGSISQAPAGAAGAGGPPGLTLSEAEFQNILATGQVSLYAGSSLGGLSGDFIVLDLAIDPALLPHLLLAAGGSNDVNVIGVIAPTVSGGALTIGESATGSPWNPGRILVSGSIGFANGTFEAGYTDVRAFHEVALFAAQDIILGSSSFISLVANVAPDQIDLAHDKPAGVLALTADSGHIFLTADVLSLAADARIVQQNTGAIGQPNGLLVLNHKVGLVPTVLTTTRAQVVDLFGVLADGNGVLHSGAAAGLGINVSGGSGGGSVRLGGFNVDQISPTGASAIASATAQATAQILTSSAASADDPTQDQEAAAAGGSVAIEPAPLMSIAQPALDAVIGDPVELGAGSEESWRRRGPRQANP